MSLLTARMRHIAKQGDTPAELAYILYAAAEHIEALRLHSGTLLHHHADHYRPYCPACELTHQNLRDQLKRH